MKEFFYKIFTPKTSILIFGVILILFQWYVVKDPVTIAEKKVKINLTCLEVEELRKAGRISNKGDCDEHFSEQYFKIQYTKTNIPFIMSRDTLQVNSLTYYYRDTN